MLTTGGSSSTECERAFLSALPGKECEADHSSLQVSNLKGLLMH